MINLAEYTTITEEQFGSMQFDSGVILSDFDPTNPTDITGDKILFATTGDISINAGKELVDLGEDVNNLHGQLKELQYLSTRSHTVTFTALNLDAITLAYALGAADTSSITGSNTGSQVSLRNYIKLSDFKDIWWVGMLIGGGVVAVNLKNALSTDDVSLSTTKDGKGNLSVTLTAFGTIRDLTLVPITYYYLPEIKITLDKEDITLTVEGTTTITASISVPTYMTNVTVTWTTPGTTVSVTADPQNQNQATITALREGRTILYATLRGETESGVAARAAHCYVTVTSGV